MASAKEVTPALLRSMPMPSLSEGDKEQRGRVLAVGGSIEVPGAICLAGMAALRAGAGKLQIGTCAAMAPHFALAIPEARVFALPQTDGGEIAPEAAVPLQERLGQCRALVLGPGMLDKAAAGQLAAALLDPPCECGAVLDSAAMAHVIETAGRTRRGGPIVITPHPGEMAGLLGMEKREVEADPLGVARATAERCGVIVVLKSGTTHIASPSGETWIFRNGFVGLATGGSGDVLAGIIGGLIARGMAAEAACLWGVWLHAEAGHRLAREYAPLGFLARELLTEIPKAMAALS